MPLLQIQGGMKKTNDSENLIHWIFLIGNEFTEKNEKWKRANLENKMNKIYYGVAFKLKYILKTE